jgi:hypothetical protein
LDLRGGPPPAGKWRRGSIVCCRPRMGATVDPRIA